ncbi:MAG: chloride channel protein [Gammaproteobacteria bacterium]
MRSSEIRRFVRSGARWNSPRRWLLRVLFWGGAVAVGGLAVLFALASEQAHALFAEARLHAGWIPLVGMPLGFAAIVFITRRFFPGAQGSGIPQTIAALAQDTREAREQLLSLRIAIGKMVLTVGGLLCGASIGREGPTVQVGAAVLHSLGRLGRFPQQGMDRALILAGGAAGVAAAFNTPLAGIVFAIEELSRSYEQRTNGTILTAVILAGMTSLALLGNYTYFGRTGATLVTDPDNLLAVLAIGVVGGLAGGLFARSLIATSQGLPGRIGQLARTRPVVFAALCGGVLAIIGVAGGGCTFGTGYAETRYLLQGDPSVPASFGVLKFVATLVSYLAGIPGGIFAPSLAVGAGLGANLATVLTDVPLNAVILLAMAAYFAGVVQAPLTAFIIVVEMTDKHDMVLLLMAAALIANGASRLVCPEPLYKALARRFTGQP